MVTLATVSQKATQRKRVVLAREQPKVDRGEAYSGNRGPLRSRVLHDGAINNRGNTYGSSSTFNARDCEPKATRIEESCWREGWQAI